MTLKTKLFAISLVTLFAGATVHANQPPVSQQPAKVNAQQKAMQLQAKLANVQKQVIKEKPELKKEQENLQASFNEVVTQAGFPKEKEEKLVEIQKKLQQADPASEEAKSMQAEMQKYQKDFMKHVPL